MGTYLVSALPDTHSRLPKYPTRCVGTYMYIKYALRVL